MNTRQDAWNHWLTKGIKENRVDFLYNNKVSSTIFFDEKTIDKKIAASVTLVHRSQSFRGHLESVQRVMDLATEGKLNLLLFTDNVYVSLPIEKQSH